MTEPQPRTSPMLLREDAPGTFRAMCLECGDHLDFFGQLTPGSVAPGDATDTITQACVSHVERCQKLTRPKSVTVLQNRNTPALFKVSILW